MIKTYVRIAYRNLRKHKFYLALNILGLSLGIAGGLVLFQFISYHLSFDRYHKNEAQLYRVVTDLHLPDGSVESEQGTPLGLTEALQNEIPRIKDQAVLLKAHSLTIGVQLKLFTEHENIAFADKHWFNLFDYTWEKGNAATSLTEPNTAVITQQLATKYFGKQDPIGQIIRLDNKYTVTVTGVLKDYPANTDTKIDLFLSRPSFKIFYSDAEENMTRNWGAINKTTNSYIWLPDDVPGKRIEEAMDHIKKKYFAKDIESVYHFHLQKLKEVHFDSRYGGVMDKTLLGTLTIVGLFLVIIACFNFINLATAQSTKRAKEIGTRKVLGSTPIAIFSQFMTETVCITLLATILSFIWIRLSLPLINDWLQIKLGFNLLQDRSLFLCTILLLGFVILVSGFYPAIILSRFKPVDALKKQVSSVRTAFYRKALIVIQNVVAQVLIVCTLIITLQIRHLKNTDIGFNKDAVLMVPLPDKSELPYLDHELRKNQEIKSVSFCLQAPSSDMNIGGSIKFDNKPWEDYIVRTIIADTAYLNTFQLKLLSGRNMQASDTVREFIVNETFLHKLGIKDPQQVIGHQLVAGGLQDHSRTIVGVVKDFNVHSLYTVIEPLLITTKRDSYQYAAIKLNVKDHIAAQQKIRKIWQAAYPENVFEYHYLDEQIDNFYHKEDLLNKLINTTAAIAIIISCLGLLGLISFFTTQRTKEIGIRKVLGANITTIVYLLSKDFLKLILLSIVIASPIAWYLMNQWLQDFAYRVNISWWIFVVAGFASILIALVTVSYQSLKAAFANPVDSLKME